MVIDYRTLRPKGGKIMGDARDALRAYGMTEAELEIWFELAAVAGKMLRLPVQHPMEQQETATEFHALQNRLLARPGMRAQVAGSAAPSATDD